MTHAGAAYPAQRVNAEPVSHSIGVDIGGTHTRAALVDSCGAVVAARRRPTREFPTFALLVDWLASAVRDLISGVPAGAARVSSIGLALPGLLDTERGTVRRSVNVRMLEGRPFARAVREAVGLRARLFTDAEATTWGEHAVRADLSVFAHLRIGTGIALGVIVDGALVDLDHGRSTHADTLIVDRSENAPECACGLHGCLEAVASGAALRRSLRALGLGDNARALEYAIQRGDGNAEAWLVEAARAVAVAIQNIAERWQPDVVVLGGGVVGRLASLFRRVEDAWHMTVLDGACRAPKLVRARLGNDAGMIGAGLLAVRGSMNVTVNIQPSSGARAPVIRDTRM